MDAVSGATERPCPHRSRVVTHGYEDIYSRSTPDAKIFQSGISPKVGKNRSSMATVPETASTRNPKAFYVTFHGLSGVLTKPADHVLFLEHESGAGAIR